ncbi:MAG: MarR family transcriptional regulator [Anaerolineaceae bacterium]|jgi:predicted ArsR family transcriptional regulator
MLEQLLFELKSGRTTRVDELALRLNTTPAMVQVMLDHLVQLNLVRRYQSCDDSCSACSDSDLCHQVQQGPPANLYYLTRND